MSVITLQVGQCGNQVGKQYFETLIQDILSTKHIHNLAVSTKESYCQELLEKFFHEEKKTDKWQARAVLVDMESKVINQILQKDTKSDIWCYPQNAYFCKKQGSGNNWANGYCQLGPEAKEQVKDLIQNQLEKCDRFDGFLVKMSLAGGTGSGVGTYLTQTVRDMYPKSFQLHEVIWPYGSGEVIVQNYNTILALSRLVDFSDSLIFIENDQIQKICSRMLGMKQTGFHEINQIIGEKIAAVLAPAHTSYRLKASIGDMLGHVSCHPSYKLLSLRTVPHVPEKSQDFTHFTWPSLLKRLKQMLIVNSPIEEGIDWNIKISKSSLEPSSVRQLNTIHSIANLLILRGKSCDEVNVQSFRDTKLYTPWMPHCSYLDVWTQQRSFYRNEFTAALISNSQASVKPLDRVLEKAWTTFSARAFIHQYKQQGLSEEDFVDSFAILEQVVKKYMDLGYQSEGSTTAK